MTKLATLASKGSPLTPAEADTNIQTLEVRTGDGWADIVSELIIRDTPLAPIGILYKGGIYLWEFPTQDLREAFANFHVPHTWKPGSMIYPHVHFTTASNLAGVVRWGFEYTWARRHDSTGQIAFPAVQTIYVDFAIPANSADTHFVCEAPEGLGIAGTGLEVDSMILMRVYGDGLHANDTFAASVLCITADLHHEVDRYATPRRAPDFYTVV
jgi:hypothetical protein